MEKEPVKFVGNGKYNAERVSEWYGAYLSGILVTVREMALEPDWPVLDKLVKQAFLDAYREGYVDALRSEQEDS